MEVEGDGDPQGDGEGDGMVLAALLHRGTMFGRARLAPDECIGYWMMSGFLETVLAPVCSPRVKACCKNLISPQNASSASGVQSNLELAHVPLALLYPRSEIQPLNPVNFDGWVAAPFCRRFEFALQKGLEKSNTFLSSFDKFLREPITKLAFPPGALLAGSTQ
ncbi:unnamed protein product [Boreogadus saida]